MENQQIEDIAKEYMQIWSAGKDTLLEKWASVDLTVEYTHFKKVLHGISEYREILRQTYHSFPDIAVSIDEINAFGEKALVKWTYTGTHTNDTLFGAAPSGKQVKVTGFSVLEFQDNKILRESGIVDNLSLLIQIGALQ